MTTIAALGPEKTFSHKAARAYADSLGLEADIRLFPTIRKTFEAVGEECTLGILPMENLVEGYVQPVLDLLLHGDLTIIDELLMPIRFAFVANCKEVKQVKRVHVQFVSLGQCSDFLDNMPDAELVSTESNGTALQNVLSGGRKDGAIVPLHALEEHDFKLVIRDVANLQNNQTRFIVIADEEKTCAENESYKTSLVIIEGADHPGMLSSILRAFARRDVNLVSIMSRPTKESIGQYHFFVDIEGHRSLPHIQEAFEEVKLENEIKVLGSYPKARSLDEITTSRKAVVRSAREFFQHDPASPAVYVAGGAGPYANTRQALKSVDLSGLKGKRVLVKPNAGRIAERDSGIVTNPEVVAAAIDAFLEVGAEVTVGESPITGVDTLQAFETCGIAGITNDRRCKLIDMDQRPAVETPVENGVAIDSLKICADALEHDVIVSIPVMKMHMHTGVTLAVKNMKGCLWRRSKVQLHMLPDVEGTNEMSLDIAIADMASVLLPHLAIIDGTVGMEGLGPSAGEAKPLDVVVVGVDAFAADAVACRLMGTGAEDVPHLRMGAERGYGVIDIDKIRIEPGNWEQWRKPFVTPPQNLSISFPDVTVLDKNSCSACQSTVLLFLKRYRKELFDYFPEKSPVRIAIGKGHDELPEGTLCVGNCVLAHKERGTFVAGCPPVASAILRSLGKLHDPLSDEDREY
jgi:prephenate dehydratase